MPSARYFSDASKIEHLFAVGQVASECALAFRHQLVAQAHIGEGAAHHDFVIAAARSVGVEVRRLHAVRDEVLSRRAVRLDGSGRRDVIGGDAVAEIAEHACAGDVFHRRRLLRHVVEVRGIFYVGRVLLPRKGLSLRHLQTAPAFVALENFAVGFLEHVAGDILCDTSFTSFVVGQMSFR